MVLRSMENVINYDYVGVDNDRVFVNKINLNIILYKIGMFK